MNPDPPDPIFLPPLHFSNERAYDRRKSSLPSLHGDLAQFAKRKLSLQWSTEESVLEKQENLSSISSGIRITARNLTPLPSASSDGYDTSTPKSVYSLPGQPYDEPSSSESSSLSARSRSATLSGRRHSIQPRAKDEIDNHKWKELVSNIKKENLDKFGSKNSRSLPVTEQPKLSTNQLLPISTDSFPMNLVRKLPSLLSGTSDPLSTFPRLNSDSIAPKDINVNMRHSVSDITKRDQDNYYKDHNATSSRNSLLPHAENNGEKRELTCPHCGETFQPPPAESKSGGCSGTLSTICTYAAMAGVVLVGCVHMAQNGGTGSQLPGGELRSFLPSRRAR